MHLTVRHDNICNGNGYFQGGDNVRNISEVITIKETTPYFKLKEFQIACTELFPKSSFLLNVG